MCTSYNRFMETNAFLVNFHPNSDSFFKDRDICSVYVRPSFLYLAFFMMCIPSPLGRPYLEVLELDDVVVSESFEQLDLRE